MQYKLLSPGLKKQLDAAVAARLEADNKCFRQREEERRREYDDHRKLLLDVTRLLFERVKAGTANEEQRRAATAGVLWLNKKTPTAEEQFDRWAYFLAAYYLSPDKIKTKAICAGAGVSCDTFYRDIHRAFGVLAVYLFGMDAIEGLYIDF